MPAIIRPGQPLVTCHLSLVTSSESEPRHELKLARRVYVSNARQRRAEQRRRRGGAGAEDAVAAIIVRVVENVVAFGAQAQPVMLAETNLVLDERVGAVGG